MKKGIYLLNKESVEEDFPDFNYVPENYWQEIQFDEVPLHITRSKIKKKDIFLYQYDIKKPFLQGYVEGWKVYINIEDSKKFEKAFRSGEKETEWVQKLHFILSSKY